MSSRANHEMPARIVCVTSPHFVFHAHNVCSAREALKPVLLHDDDDDCNYSVLCTLLLLSAACCTAACRRAHQNSNILFDFSAKCVRHTVYNIRRRRCRRRNCTTEILMRNFAYLCTMSTCYAKRQNIVASCRMSLCWRVGIYVCAKNRHIQWVTEVMGHIANTSLKPYMWCLLWLTI